MQSNFYGILEKPAPKTLHIRDLQTSLFPCLFSVYSAWPLGLTRIGVVAYSIIPPPTVTLTTASGIPLPHPPPPFSHHGRRKLPVLPPPRHHPAILCYLWPTRNYLVMMCLEAIKWRLLHLIWGSMGLNGPDCALCGGLTLHPPQCFFLTFLSPTEYI